MGFRIKSWTIFISILVTLCILVCVGIATYHWKIKAFTHHGDPHHITSGGDAINHTHYENKHPHAIEHIDNNTGHHHFPRSTEETTTAATPICRGFEWECNIRLEQSVYPVHYDVYFNPDTENGVYNGRVEMVLNVSKSVDHLRVHMKGLDIIQKTLSRDNIQIDIQEMLIYDPNEFLVFRVSKSLEPAQYKLVIEFEGNLTQGIVGLYRSQYVDPIKNITRYVVSSKFQPTYARRAFPCLDEPGFKSTFSVSIVKPTDLVALSNMPVFEEVKNKPAKGFTTVHFEKSVPMVTYLVAVAVGDFDYRFARTKRGVPVRVFATKFQVNKTQYAVDVAPSMIDFYEDYFDIKYPLPKMDIIGIPDFVSGAMEHWGLISFRESNLLYHSGMSSAGNKQRIATILAHEIAHMWFGNLMTLKWWSDLWLNEGFASYCEYKAVNHVHPDWEILTQFVSQDLTPVLVLDGKLSSHPIVQPVSNPDQITEIFDTISYNKGASVIRMLENFIGPKTFQAGVRNFLKAFSYANADTADLWSALQSEVGKGMNITLLMDTWTRQMGYPILHVERTNDNITLRQERFFENPEHDLLPSTPFNYRWEIPLRIMTENDKATFQIHLMGHKQHTLTLPIQNSTKWIKLNADYFGYFRVKYEESMWRHIMTSFRSSFTPAERCGLIDDIFSLAYSQQLDYALALEFGQGLRDDVHLVSWDCAENHLWQISTLLEKSSVPDAYVLFRKYITNLTSTLNRNFSWTDDEREKHLGRLLKIKIFMLGCSHGEATCLGKSHKLFNDWIQKGVIVPPGLRPVVYKWGMWQASEDVWDTLWIRYIQESDSQERTRLLSGLASTQNTWVIRRFINLAQNETLVRRQDFFTAMKFVSLNPTGNPIIWTYYRNEYEELVKRFTVNDRYFGKLILDITSDYSSEIRLQEMKTFFAMYPNAGAGKRARETALETVKNNIQWAKRNVPVIHQWLKATIV